jgi:uncharacterized protein YyaL (SSP411 family)
LLTALCKASAALQDDKYKKMAEHHFDFILRAFRKENTGAMLHTYKEGIAKYPAFLDDYSYFIEACLHLYELTYNTRYLQEAKDYCNYVLLNFADDDSSLLYFTHKEQTDIVVRKKEVYDGATPSGNAVMAGNLFKLSIIYDIAEWRQLAVEMLGSMLPMVVKYPSSFGLWSVFFMQQVEGMNEIAVIGEGYIEACREISGYYIPNKIIMGAEKPSDDFPLLQNKILANNLLIYLCKNYSCMTPDNTVQNLLSKLLPQVSI